MFGAGGGLGAHLQGAEGVVVEAAQQRRAVLGGRGRAEAGLSLQPVVLRQELGVGLLAARTLP